MAPHINRSNTSSDDVKNSKTNANANSNVAMPQTKAQALQLLNIRNALPAHVFEKDLTKSLYYLFFDYFMWLGGVSLMYILVQSNAWNTLPFFVKTIAYILFCNFVGFFMWCIFVVGHDCGHGTFSEYEWLNDIIGHITHSSILVPYYPWQLSHRRHHLYHNHAVKDYSHPWYTEERMQDPNEQLYRTMHQLPLLRSSFPLYGWFIYLIGKPDGSHFIPFRSSVSIIYLMYLMYLLY